VFPGSFIGGSHFYLKTKENSARIFYIYKSVSVKFGVRNVPYIGEFHEHWEFRTFNWR
jgi:hypothetical protein